MTLWRRAVAVFALVVVGLLVPASAMARCCRGAAAAKTCCCPRGTTPDPADRLARACCQPREVQVAAPVGTIEIVDLLSAPALPVAREILALPVAPSSSRDRTIARARAPDVPLWLSFRSLRC